MAPKKNKRPIARLDIAKVAQLIWIIATSEATPWQRHQARLKLEGMGGRLPLSKYELANPYTPEDDPFDKPNPFRDPDPDEDDPLRGW